MSTDVSRFDAILTNICVVSSALPQTKAPTAVCMPGPNPSGIVPGANSQASFWTISASDNCPDSLRITLVDSELNQAFDGLFQNDTNVKYVQAPGTKALRKESGSGVVAWYLTGKGNLQVNATDGSGGEHVVDCTAPSNNGRISIRDGSLGRAGLFAILYSFMLPHDNACNIQNLSSNQASYNYVTVRGSPKQ
jgi:hypothetical protein